MKSSNLKHRGKCGNCGQKGHYRNTCKTNVIYKQHYKSARRQRNNQPVLPTNLPKKSENL